MALERVAGYFTAEPMRVSAWLRLPLIVLIVLLGSNPNIEMWHVGVYYGVLAVYTVSAIVWVLIAVRGHVPMWVAPAATAVAAGAPRAAQSSRSLGAGDSGGVRTTKRRKT